MIAIGYEFHFAKERLFIVTPSGEELELIQKAGLFWLRWRRSSGGSPHTTRRDSPSLSPSPDQRQRKAGSGASADEERLAALERSLNDANADIDIEERQEEAHKDNSDLGESPSTIRQATEERQSPGGLGESPSTTRQATRDSDADDSDDSDTLTDGVPRGGARALPSRTRPDPRSGGRSRTRSADQMVVPERRAAIGAPQDLDDEEKDFLKIAFELKLPMVMQQRNPKTQRSTSRARYEKYKSAKTLWNLGPISMVLCSFLYRSAYICAKSP